MLKKRIFLLLCVLGLMLSMMSCKQESENSTVEGEESKTTEQQAAKENEPQTEEKEPEKEPEKEEEPVKKEESSKKEEESEKSEEGKKEENKTEKTPEKKEETTNETSSSNSSGGSSTSTQTASNWSSKNLTADEIEALLNDPYMILVNRQNKVSSKYTGMDLVSYSGQKLNRTCLEALKKLMKAGEKAGYNYVLYSGYRTYNTQYNKYYNKIAYYKNKGYSEEKAIELTDQYYAQPGASEHHTGLAADVCIPRIVNKYACLHEAYADTPEFKWFSTHAHEYGFILRYGDGQSNITGYNYEPWHYRYVGVDVASEIYRRGITYEEFIWELEDRLEELRK